MSSFNLKFKHVRELLGFKTQELFAEHLGHHSVNKIKKAESSTLPSLRTVQDICFRYPFLVDYLMGITNTLPNVPDNISPPQALTHFQEKGELRKPFSEFNTFDFNHLIASVNIGERLSVWRTKTGFNTEKITKLIGLEKTAVSNNFNKAKGQSFEVMYKICQKSPEFSDFLIGVFDYIGRQEHPESFSRRFRLSRAYLNKSQRDFANELNMKVADLQKIESTGNWENSEFKMRPLQIFCRTHIALANWVLDRTDFFPNIEKQKKAKLFEKKLTEKIKEIFLAEKVNDLELFGDKLVNYDSFDALRVIAKYPKYACYLSNERMPDKPEIGQITPQEKMMQDLLLLEKTA